MDNLLVRLGDRIRFSPAVEMDAQYVRSDELGNILPPRPPNPPLSHVELRALENRFGFPLPTIVRRIATEVADGGFGPAYGINRLRHPPGMPFGPHWAVKMSVESWHEFYRSAKPEDALPDYPKHFIRYCEVGCNISICVDCTSDAGWLFVDDPNLREPLQSTGETVEQWLSRWLNDGPWPEQTYT